MKTKARHKITSLLLAFALAVGMVALPSTTLTASAAGVQSGMPATVNISTTTTTNPTVIGFGGKQWVVIGYDGTGVNSDTDTMTLLLANGSSYGTTKFHSGGTNYYGGGALHAAMNTAANTVSAGEQALIEPVDLAGGSANHGQGGYLPNNVAGAQVANQLFWPLSVYEVNAIHGNERKFSGLWWLRSAGFIDNCAAIVGVGGGVSSSGDYVNLNFGVRPALKINLSSVIFSSSAAGGKPTTVGANLSVAQTPTGAIKLTVLDTNQELNVIATTAQQSQIAGTLTFSYDGATTGGNQWVSCVLEQGGVVTHYGKLVNSSNAASGSLSIPLTGVVNGTYTLRIFSEQDNGTNKTDFASDPVTMQVDVTGGSGTVSNFGGTSAVAPTIGGGTTATTDSINLTEGYTTAQTKTYTIAGAPAPTVAVTSDGGTGASVTNTGALTIPVGLTKGIYTIVFEASNGHLPNATMTITVNVTALPPTGTAPTITTNTLPNGTKGTTYSQTLAATGTAPIAWSLDSGSLPAGLNLSSSGVISGTPTTAGSVSFTVKAANGTAPDATQALTIVIDPVGTPTAPTISITNQPAAESTVTAGSISGSISVSATVSDGSIPTYQWYYLPSNTAISGATGSNFPIPTGLSAGSHSYYCIVSSGSAMATSTTAKVLVVPPVVGTAKPSVTAQDPMNLDLNGSSTGFVTVTLGASGTAGDVKADRAVVTVEGAAVTATPTTLTTDGNVTITAQSTGAAKITVVFSGGDVTDNSYDRIIEIVVTDSTAIEPPVITTPSGNGSGGSSSGGSNKADTRPVVGGTTTGTTTSNPLTAAEATGLFEAALAAKPTGATALSIKVSNATSVSKAVLAELAAVAKKNGVTLTVHFDTIVGGKVVSRLSVNPAIATTDLNVAITENKALAARFAKFFGNPLAVHTIPAAGSVAIKLPENLKAEDLVIYSYNAETNTYNQLTGVKPWVDTNGYLHFDAQATGEIVISQGKLVKK